MSKNRSTGSIQSSRRIKANKLGGTKKERLERYLKDRREELKSLDLIK